MQSDLLLIMCSIAGIYKFVGNVSDQDYFSLATSLEILESRGPDDQSTYKASDCCLMGGNRLAIQSSLKDGKMPFLYGKYCCFYNGEIYNYTSFDSSAVSDGKVILPLFEALGIECFNKLDAEFAVSIYDGNTNILYLARDSFGTKPLYFSFNKNSLIYGSSESLLNNIHQHELCGANKSNTYVHSYSVQEPYSSFVNIFQVPPGHVLLVSNLGAKLICYNKWKNSIDKETETHKLFAKLESTFELRFRYSSCLAIPLSGGIDSGIIAFLADKMGINYELFSIDKMNGKATKETKYIYERLNRLKHYKKITLIDVDQDLYFEALQNIYKPNYYNSIKFDSGCINTYALFKAINASGIKVAIDGTGGDELFHGYKFRDEIRPIEGWPKWWPKNHYYYSIFSTLLDYTSKSDRAGGYFSIETRFPFQSRDLYNASTNYPASNILKWPLRSLLLTHLDYGNALKIDQEQKRGFSLKNYNKLNVYRDMVEAWCKANNVKRLPVKMPVKFPFIIG